MASRCVYTITKHNDMTKRERENTTARLFSTTARLRLTATGAVNFAFSTSTSLLIPLRQKGVGLVDFSLLKISLPHTLLRSFLFFQLWRMKRMNKPTQKLCHLCLHCYSLVVVQVALLHTHLPNCCQTILTCKLPSRFPKALDTEAIILPLWSLHCVEMIEFKLFMNWRRRD